MLKTSVEVCFYNSYINDYFSFFNLPTTTIPECSVKLETIAFFFWLKISLKLFQPTLRKSEVFFFKSEQLKF